MCKACDYTIHGAQHHFGWDNTLVPAERVEPGATILFHCHDSSAGQLGPSSTLQSVVDFVTDCAKASPSLVSLVLASPTRVSVLSELSSRARRAEYLVASAKHAFPSQDFMVQEDFVMMVLRCFRDSADRAELLALVGNMSQEAVRTASDDGITQIVATKQGTRLGSAVVKSTYQLAPRAPFPEVVLSQSPWFLRVRNDNNGPRVALFDASGGEYLKDANNEVGAWLANRLPGVTVQFNTPFVSTLFTPLDDQPLAQSRHILITALARDKQTGTVYSADGSRLESTGTAPLLLEPVQAVFTLAGAKPTGVRALDAYGVPSGKAVPVAADGSVTIDGTCRSYYYEVKR